MRKSNRRPFQPKSWLQVSVWLCLIGIMVMALQACSSPPPPTPAPAPTAPAATAPPAVAPTTAPAATAPPAGAPTTAPSGRVRTTPSHSSHIAITSDDSKVLVVNPLNNSVTVLNVAGDANTKAAEVRVGTLPQTVGISPDDRFAYVTNQ